LFAILLSFVPEIFRQVFKLPDLLLYGIATIKSSKRGIGFNYKLKESIEIDLSRYQEFEFKIDENVYKGGIYIPLGPPPALGDNIIVTVKRTGFHLEIPQVKKFLLHLP